MRYTAFGPLGEVSRLALGGGGVGGVWGAVGEQEAIDTIRAAIEAGMTLLDTAPGYRHCEILIGKAFEGALDSSVRVSSKVWLAPDRVAHAYETSLEVLRSSQQAMRVQRIHVLFLHNGLVAENSRHGVVAAEAVSYRAYRDSVAPALQRLVDEGHIDAWGITGGSTSPVLLDALTDAPAPGAIQVATNALNSAGDMCPGAEEVDNRTLASTAAGSGVGVMGIRVLQAGALSPRLDRPVGNADAVSRDHRRAGPFLKLCAEWGEDPVETAYRYVLAMPSVSTLVTGPKNRAELRDALRAQERGALDPRETAAIDGVLGHSGKGETE